jgi:hypothetical protein
MGDPAEPGEDQFATIIIEGPPAGANQNEVNAYKQKFEDYKKAVQDLFKTWGDKGLKVRIKKIENLPKGSAGSGGGG